MRLLSVLVLIAACFVSSSGSVGSKSAAERPDISRSGSDFLEICSTIDSERKEDPVQLRSNRLSGARPLLVHSISSAGRAGWRHIAKRKMRR